MCKIQQINNQMTNSPPGFTILMETSLTSCSKSLGTIEMVFSSFTKNRLSVDIPHTRNLTGEGLLSFFTILLQVLPFKIKPLAG